MSWEEIGSGNVLQASNIAGLITTVPGGNNVRLSLALRFIPSSSLINTIKSRMESAGIQGVQVYSGSPELNIVWKRNNPVSGIGLAGIDDATLIIIAIILALIVAALIISWVIFKQVGPAGSTMLIAAGLGIVVLGLVIWFGRKR